MVINMCWFMFCLRIGWKIENSADSASRSRNKWLSVGGERGVADRYVMALRMMMSRDACRYVRWLKHKNIKIIESVSYLSKDQKERCLLCCDGRRTKDGLVILWTFLFETDRQLGFCATLMADALITGVCSCERKNESPTNCRRLRSLWGESQFENTSRRARV